MIKISIFLISLLLLIGTVRLIYNQPPEKEAADPVPTVLGQKTQKTCQPEITLDTLVDKFHGLPENYIPPDLIVVGNFKLRSEAAGQLNKMVAAMGKINLFVSIDSAYRSYDDQKQLFQCPCPNAQFDIYGKVIAGPPPRPLDRVEFTIQGGEIEVTGKIIPG